MAPAAIDEIRERKPGHAFGPQTPVLRTGSNTHHGVGMPDPFGPGLPADTARAVPYLYKWQPIGNYLAKPFPEWPSVLEGLEHAPFQIRDYGHADDMYASVGFNDMAEDERTICKIIMGNNVFRGPDSSNCLVNRTDTRPVAGT